MTLVEANKESFSTGFNIDFEVIGGSSHAVNSRRCGFIDDEFAKYGLSDGNGIAASRICAVLWKQNQEQQREIDELKAALAKIQSAA